MSRFILTLVFLIDIGCSFSKYPHVSLQAPTPDNSLQERGEAYQKLKTDKDKFTPTTTEIDIKPILLEGGTEVFWLEDLLPLVPETSRTAIKINDALSMYKKGTKKIRQGAAIFIGGSFLFVPSILIPNRTVAVTVGVTGGLVATYGMIRSFSGELDRVYYFNNSEAALNSYNKDLLVKLNLCVVEQRLVDCGEVNR